MCGRSETARSMSIPGFDSTQAAYDAAEPDNTDAEADTPECGGCHPSYRNACIHCGPTD